MRSTPGSMFLSATWLKEEIFQAPFIIVSLLSLTLAQVQSNPFVRGDNV